MGDITDRAIRDHVVAAALDGAAGDIQAITAELLAQYPVSEWQMSGLGYTHPRLTEDAFWTIAFRHLD